MVVVVAIDVVERTVVGVLVWTVVGVVRVVVGVTTLDAVVVAFVRVVVGGLDPAGIVVAELGLVVAVEPPARPPRLTLIGVEWKLRTPARPTAVPAKTIGALFIGAGSRGSSWVVASS
jgi:hypothetical protein